MVAPLDRNGDQARAERNERKDECPQPQLSTGWHYQADFGLDSPRL
jgi:hypothetical protein